MPEKYFTIEQLDQARLIKVNDLQEITNPSMFNAGGITGDGLLSQSIFGTTMYDRSQTFAYLDLEEYFIQPYLYKVWLKVDKNLRSVVYGTKKYKIDSNGYLVEDENGGTGLKWLKANIQKIKFKNTKRDSLLKVLMSNKDKLFTNKFIIIPPYYRDVNNDGGRVGVGDLNKLYINLMNDVKALRESNDYGLDFADNIRGRINEDMLKIYNWLTIGEAVPGQEHTGSGIFKKYGAMRRSVMSKTTDYSARLVLSAARTDSDTKEELMVDMDHCAVPLAAALVIYYPFMLYELRQFFNNEFGGKTEYALDNGTAIELLNPETEFSDAKFDKQMNKFIHGYTNRLEPIEIPNKENKKVFMRFKGYHITADEYTAGKRENEKMLERILTWCDLFYILAVKISQDKQCIITRYPMDSYFNQFTCGAHISSTIKTEPMVINGVFYKWYPKITESDIGSNTGNKFIDTLSIANPYCGLIGADFDGDQVTLRCAFTVEANQELKKYNDSNAQFITLEGVNGRMAEKEAIQAMYNLTLVLPETKLTDPKF